MPDADADIVAPGSKEFWCLPWHSGGRDFGFGADCCASRRAMVPPLQSPSTQYLRAPVPKTIQGRVFGTRIAQLLGN